ncbi:transmembrane prolyl 4-hydroxylase-like isoform X3 [Phycodurus eques]|uniref:transmembrane prolyl 4-hydroxylase-like isoform X3 n=1 Tax=Phycodurus eques TaxID=693459 RepID=UPI002ACD6846|nr:transmembrane prolyl 4-hydroxylase-like isoform X3 [Phycodurus eques]
MEGHMENIQEHLRHGEDSGVGGIASSSFGKPRIRSTRLPVQRSSICSRAYFVVVMVFFHVYILNVIALLLYVHYNNGHGDIVSDERHSSPSVGEGESPALHPTAPPVRDPRKEEQSHRFRLPRIEGIRVGHVQPVSLVSDRTHKMTTLGLKPLLFEIPGFLSEEECRVVVQLALLKGLMESQMTAAGRGQEEPTQPLLSLSTEEVFSLLDLNQDGRLQKQEIVSHSRSRDGTWLRPENLRQILAGLEACSTGMLSLEEFKRVYDISQSPGEEQSGKLRSQFKQRSKHTGLHQGPGSHHVLQTLRRSSVEEGGETTFPVADNRTYDELALVQDGVDLTDTRKTCVRGNLRVKPTVGTALLLYNHLSDGQGWMGELDEYSLHGDCPVKRGLKWVANSWVNVDPDYQRQARYQRLVADGHRAQSGTEEHSQTLSHMNLHQDL